MKKILAVALVAFAGCGSEKTQKPITYGAPQAPTLEQQSAMTTAQTTLQGSVGAFVTPTAPAAGAPGLADQLAAQLGGTAALAKMPTASSAKLAQAIERQAFDTTGMAPCSSTQVVGTVTTVTWSGCHLEGTSVDPSGTITVIVDLAGTLTWDAATRKTSWAFDETISMSGTSNGQPIAMNATGHLGGSMTVTDSTIDIGSGSTTDAQTRSMGMTFNETIDTALTAHLDYVADPFCITGGSLKVEQRVTMAGVEQARGWDFAWTGCDAFTVAEGS